MKTPRSLNWAHLLVAALLITGAGCGAHHQLVVYCAHDAIYAEKVLHDFEKRTGIPVAVRFDSEATKSLGLVELLLQEKAHPRGDVFWNNELLGTLQLADEDMLVPYKGAGWARIPAGLKDPEGRWTGFAARLRVVIRNVNRPLENAPSPQVAIAKPLYGTTRTHYTVLWQLWGPEKLQAWHRDWRAHGVQEVGGNAAVKNLVAEGVCSWGYTDSDDFFEAKDAGQPVALEPVRLDNGATICIPNTVAIIRGTPRLREAQQLADFLLSEENELELARSSSRQIPLGPVDEQQLPDEVKELKHWAADAYPLSKLGDARQVCLAWLKAEYLK